MRTISTMLSAKAGPRAAPHWWFLAGLLSLGWHLLTGNPWPILVAFLCLLGGLARLGD